MPVQKEQNRAKFHILTDEGVYRERTYRSEQELESTVTAHADEVFGEKTLYFDHRLSPDATQVIPDRTPGHGSTNIAFLKKRAF